MRTALVLVLAALALPAAAAEFRAIGDRAAVMYVIREYSPRQGRERISEQMAVIRVSGGKIVSIVGYYDGAEFQRVFWDVDKFHPDGPLKEPHATTGVVAFVLHLLVKRVTIKMRTCFAYG